MSGEDFSIEIANWQKDILLSDKLLNSLTQVSKLAWLKLRGDSNKLQKSKLAAIAQIDIALVNDEESERVHIDFMGISGATDVISFSYGEVGELVIGMGIVRQQAKEYGEPEMRELLRYIVHGLLHIAGYDDQEAEETREMMEKQEELVIKYWPQVEAFIGAS